MLDKANVDDISVDRQLWERVIVKLSLRAMPPVGMPLRPSEQEYQSILSYLQTGLDNLANDKLNPGRVTLHRLNRTEYANAIRDLLDLQIDVTELLPADNIGQGFDNIADVLAFSPLLMEQYMFAAGRISRTAVGPSSMLPASHSYRNEDVRQEMFKGEDFPLGSRGGIAVRHYFPLDGEYSINVRLHRNAEGFIRGMRQEHKFDIHVDHESVGFFKIGGEKYGRSGPQFNRNQNSHYLGDPAQSSYEFTADDKLKVTFPAKAGMHLVTASFLDEGTKPAGILMPPRLMLEEIGSFKGGNPAVAEITVTGPYAAKGPGNTASRNKIFVCQPKLAEEQEVCARQILSRLARIAYRQPATNEDVSDLMQLFRQGSKQSSFPEGIQLALQSILSSPRFLFRIEQDPEGTQTGQVYRISDIELASRLSFFLWSSIPDDELLTLAEQGRLSDPLVLSEQVRRMLADARSESLVTNFGGQWLALRNMDFAAPHPRIFMEFDEELRAALQKESELWFGEMIEKNHSIKELLTSDFTYLNERIARHYGIPGVYGSRFQRVTLNGYDERKGVFGKGSLLTATSYGNRTSPVLRGKWVLENLLNMPPPPPPEDVPGLIVENESGEPLTLREATEQHRANPACSACHKLMDPIGFALESFDAIGAYRTRYNDTDSDVDASGILFNGSEFRNINEFRDKFAEHSDRVVHTVTEKMLTYALGRSVEYYDQPVVRNIVRKIASENYKWSSLFMAIIQSTPFQHRIAR